VCGVEFVRSESEPQEGHFLRAVVKALIVTAERVTLSHFARSITLSKSSAGKLIDIRDSVIHRVIMFCSTYAILGRRATLDKSCRQRAEIAQAAVMKIAFERQILVIGS
jgi:hypothetical protein